MFESLPFGNNYFKMNINTFSLFINKNQIIKNIFIINLLIWVFPKWDII